MSSNLQPQSLTSTLSTVNHQGPDCRPSDLGGYCSYGILAIDCNRLKQCLGIGTGDICVWDVVQQSATIEPTDLDRIGVLTIELG
jgi:hypothetical protein